MTDREKALAYFRHREAQIPMPGARAMYQEAIKALEQPTIEPQQWIPCSERLPEESGLYIVTNVGRWIEPVGTRYYNIRADGGFWSGHPGDKVLAWMPLPEPYKGAET